MRANLRLAALALSASILPSAAQAAPIIYETVLSGLSEAPPNASPGTGAGTVTIDVIAHTMRVQAIFSGLLGTTTAAHIHVIPVLPAATGGVATQTPSFAGFPLGVSSGSYDQTFDLTLTSSFNPSFVALWGGTAAGAEAALAAGLAEGRAYLNVHSNLFPGGEIRGTFLPAVPEPASWALMIGGFALAGGMLRGRRVRVSPA